MPILQKPQKALYDAGWSKDMWRLLWRDGRRCLGKGAKRKWL